MGAIRVLECAPTRALFEGRQLQLHVVCTSPEGTRAALRVACRYARDLGARIRLLAPKVVPYPRSLEDPAVSASVTESRLKALVSECDVDVEIQVLLCRVPKDAVLHWLPEGCIALIGRRRRWGLDSCLGLIRAVRRRGVQVIVVNVAERALQVPTS